MEVELVPWETAKIGINKGILKYTDMTSTKDLKLQACEIEHVVWFNLPCPFIPFLHAKYFVYKRKFLSNEGFKAQIKQQKK